MNIFVLCLDTKKCAEYHVDRHVVKMIIELAQLLCSAHIILDGVTEIEGTPIYKLTHKNHPCAIWTRQSSSNYEWLYSLFYDLCEEYTFRYGKIHLCETKLRDVLVFTPNNIPKTGLTDFALAMPDEYKTNDPVESYRNYYRMGKAHLSSWKKRPVPEWYNNFSKVV